MHQYHDASIFNTPLRIPRHFLQRCRVHGGRDESLESTFLCTWCPQLPPHVQQSHTFNTHRCIDPGEHPDHRHKARCTRPLMLVFASCLVTCSLWLRDPNEAHEQAAADGDIDPPHHAPPPSPQMPPRRSPTTTLSPQHGQRQPDLDCAARARNVQYCAAPRPR
ncbi:hypothetical protein O3P69_014086 [Scylla paramamosain]|uniref:Uncharacterized protein n=1 Tax=Scylla paramamosain TaxID=85552 RepID=A0AAW0SRF6_SCYPA